MSATCSSYPHRQRWTPALWRSLVSPAACIMAVVSAFGLLGEPSALAADLGDLQPVTRIAAAGAGEPEAFAFRPGLPVRETEIDADLKLLLAQNGPPSKTGAAFGDDTILVAFALSVPQSIDEDIAKQHGLELVDRTELPSLGLRVVRYRAQANAPIAPIIANLRKDQRISSAQANAEYRLPSQSGPATEVSRLKDRLGVARQAKRDDPPRASVRRRSDGKTAAVNRVAPKSAEQPGIIEAAATPKGRQVGQGRATLGIGRSNGSAISDRR